MQVEFVQGEFESLHQGLLERVSVTAAEKERHRAVKNALAVKLAHEELGEKISLFVGATLAATVHGSLVAGNVLTRFFALLLIECVTDEIKASFFASVGLHIRHVESKFHIRSALGVIFMGVAASSSTLGSVRYQCYVDALGVANATASSE